MQACRNRPTLAVSYRWFLHVKSTHWNMIVYCLYIIIERESSALAISLQKQKSFVFAPSKIFFAVTLTSQFLHNKWPKKISISLCFEIHPIIQMYSGFTINCNNLKSTTLGQEPASIIHYTRPGSSIKQPNQI